MHVLPCSMARIGHSGMTADEVTENVEAAVKTVMEKIRMVSVEEQSGVFFVFESTVALFPLLSHTVI